MSTFALQVFLKGGQIVQIGYRSAEAAVAAEAKLKLPTEFVDVEDDFGASLSVGAAEISGTLIIDEEAASELSVLRGLLQARANQRAQKMAATDPVLNGGVVVPRPGVLIKEGDFKGRG